MQRAGVPRVPALQSQLSFKLHLRAPWKAAVVPGAGGPTGRWSVSLDVLLRKVPLRTSGGATLYTSRNVEVGCGEGFWGHALST